MPVDTKVLGLDIRYFFVAYAIAVGAAFLPAECSFLRYGAVVAVLGIYAWYVKAHFEADATIDAVDLRAAALRAACDRRALPSATRKATRGCASSTSRCWSRWRMIVGGAFVFVDARRAPVDSCRPRPGAAGAGHRAHRDRAAREVQQPDLGAPGQGHAGDGQHHRRDGLPVVHPDGDRHRAGGRRVDGVERLAAQLRLGRHRVRCRRRSIFLPMVRRGTLTRPRTCSIGGVFYLVYLALRLVVGIATRPGVSGMEPCAYTRAPMLTQKPARPP